MSSDRHARVKEIFLAVCSLHAAERPTVLDEMCGDDAGLRAEVESLLGFHEEPIEEIADYRVLRKVGEGGMGEVYEAEQLRPVRRRVALKVIKAGMDSKVVIARFESERQALALMDHPNIARIYDAGTTERGRPYFAMEFVKGEPITTYCDRLRLSTSERLELFVQVCQGIQHAHRKGIIHRDIKPSNVQVRILDDRPVPTIIDFGIAKATQQRLTEKTMWTATGMMIGTPEYMSPEQAEMTGLDVDTRTDVYSLGVVLYELLAGALPVEPRNLREAGFDEIRRRIREDEPSKPSTRVSTLGEETTETARRRRTDPAGLRRELRGDLDWITLKALEKDPARRYGSPAELADDIGRHLRHELVVASPPSTVYRGRKFVRRHRLGVTAGLAVALALMVGLGLALGGLVRARNAERIAKQEAATAKKVSELVVSMFDDLNRTIPGHVGTPEEILDRGMQRIESELAGEPVLQARLMNYVAGSYGSLGRTGRARELVERSVALLREHLPPDHPQLGNALSLLGQVAEHDGDLDRAERLHEEALGIWMRVLRPDQVSLSLGRTHQSLGAIRLQKGDFPAARAHLDRSAEILEVYAGTYPMHLAYTLFWRAILASETDLDHEAARSRLERSLVILEEEFGTSHNQLVRVLHWLGRVHYRLGDAEPARAYYERALALRERMSDGYGEALSWTGLGELLLAAGELEAARSRLEPALEVLEEAGGAGSPDADWCVRCLATVYRRSGDVDGARELLERNLEHLERSVGEEHPLLSRTLHDLGYLELRAGKLERAKRWYGRALEIQAVAWETGHYVNTWALYGLARVAALEGKPGEALDLLKRALDCGYDRADILEDQDLASLRGSPEFEEIIAEVRRRRG